MATATELAIDSTASADQLAEAIFGNGIQVVSASFQGDPASVGIYSGAQATLGGIVPGDTGVILSSGFAADFTNGGGGVNTNINAGTSANPVGGIDGDAQLNAVSGRATFDGAILNASFIPDGDFLTMQFVFTSEEYPEYVNSTFNDAFGVWVNGTFVPATITTTGEVAINTVNNGSNQNLYIDNTADQFNTEMDGFTRILSIKAPVNAGQINTIKIGIADAGDAGWDSNLLIIGDSVQTIALAFDDKVQLLPNSSRTFDILGNDNDQTDGGLTITHINGTPVVAGQSVTLGTGERVQLNADGTVTIFSDGDLGTNTLNYTIVDSVGNTDSGFVTITTAASLTRDGIVEGTTGADVIQSGYAGDPDGDLIDNADALGVGGTTVDGDYILAGAGNDSITAGQGADVIYAGDDNDTVFGGAGNDWASLGPGNDSFGSFSADSAGDDTVFGDAGADYIISGEGADKIYGGAGDDTLSGGVGSDALSGGADADTINLINGFGSDVIDGGETVTTGADLDLVDITDVNAPVNVVFSADEAGTLTSGPDTASFAGIEKFQLGDGDDLVNASATAQGTDIHAGAGNDTLIGGTGADTLAGGAGSDVFVLGNDFGNDVIDGDGVPDTYVQIKSVMFSDQLQTAVGTEYSFANGALDYMSSNVYAELGSNNGNPQSLGTLEVGAEVWVNGVAYTVTAHGGANADVTFDAGSGLATAQTSVAVYTLSNGSETIYASFLANPGDQIPEGAEILGFEYTNSFQTGAPQQIGYNDSGTDQFDAAVVNEANVSGPTNGVDVLDASGEGANQTLIFTGNEAGTLTNGTDTVSFVEIEQFVLGAGNDLANASATTLGVNILGGDGDDTLLGGNGEDTLFGGAGQDSLFGGNATDYIEGGAGNDTIDGGFNTDTVYGGDGNDLITDTGNSSSDDTLYGGAGNDTIAGGIREDLIDGGSDADQIVIENTFGDDTIIGGETVTTGADYDTLNVTAVTSSVTAVFTGNEAGTLTQGTSGATFTGIERLELGGGSDLADASATTVGTEIYGGGGNDTLIGGAGFDTLVGGDGNDQLTGGADADSLQGGSGRDTIFGGIGDFVDGGAVGDDVDVLDLSAYRHSGTKITYTNNDPNTQSGTVEFFDAAGNPTGTLNFSEIEKVVACFTPGSQILTDEGEIAVERLMVGDRVLTRDNGYQPITWMARRDLKSAELRENIAFNPVRIAKGAFGEGLPERDLTVSPQHRMLMTGPKAELLFGEREVLVSATHLVGMAGVTRQMPSSLCYLHFMCEAHEVVRSDGAWTESFQPGARTTAGLDNAQRDEFLALFPDALTDARFASARRTLKHYEAEVLLRS